MNESNDIHTDTAWVNVIQKMDEAYTDLVRTQVEVEQKNVELEEAQQFFDSVQRSMNDVLIVCDNNGRIESINHALTQLTQKSEDALVGAQLIDLLSPASVLVFNEFEANIVNGTVRDCEIALQSEAGDVPLSVNCSARLNHRGRKVGMVLIGRPLGELQRAYKELNAAHAELKIAQQRLVQSEKMASLGRLVAGVAHELNNPISFVYGNMHVLSRYTSKLSTYFDAVSEGASREELRDMRQLLKLDKAIKDLNSLVEGTVEGAVRVKDIVNDLRQFSSSQSSAKSLFDVVHVVKSALTWIQKDTGTEVNVQLHLPESFDAFGHAGQIHQVVVNLIQNAFDAMTDVEQPLLDISLCDDKNRMMLRIVDNGCGIPDEAVPKLFEPFFTTKPVGKGTGLGLSISYGIVADHKGELTITRGENGGAVATLSLPIQEPKDA